MRLLRRVSEEFRILFLTDRLDYVLFRSVSYKIVINGKETSIIHLSRGIRQGDLLSLYLFILISDSVLCLLNKL